MLKNITGLNSGVREEAREWYLGWDPLSDYQWGTNHPQHHSHTRWHVGEWTRDQPKFLRWSWQFYIIRRWVRKSVIKNQIYLPIQLLLCGSASSMCDIFTEKSLLLRILFYILESIQQLAFWCLDMKCYGTRVCIVEVLRISLSGDPLNGNHTISQVSNCNPSI